MGTGTQLVPPTTRLMYRWSEEKSKLTSFINSDNFWVQKWSLKCHCREHSLKGEVSLYSWSWSYKQNLSVNLCFAHFKALLLVEILEQPIRMLKNENIFIGSGPGLQINWFVFDQAKKYLYLYELKRLNPNRRPAVPWYFPPTVSVLLPRHTPALQRHLVRFLHGWKKAENVQP